MPEKTAPRFAFKHTDIPAPTASVTASGSVVTLDSSGIPAVQSPNDVDIFKAVTELEKKIQQLSKNQKTIEAKLDHITARLNATNNNLIMGVQYLKNVVNSVGWWVTGDSNTAEKTWPSTPHWK